MYTLQCIHTYKGAEMQRGKEAETQRGIWAERQKGRFLERERGRGTEMQRNKEAKKQRGGVEEMHKCKEHRYTEKEREEEEEKDVIMGEGAGWGMVVVCVCVCCVLWGVGGANLQHNQKKAEKLKTEKEAESIFAKQSIYIVLGII